MIEERGRLMKKDVLGAVLTLCGTIMDTGIFIAAAVYAPSLNSGDGSKMWYAIFGAPTYGNEVNRSLNLGIPFVIATLSIVIGIILLARWDLRKIAYLFRDDDKK